LLLTDVILILLQEISIMDKNSVDTQHHT